MGNEISVIIPCYRQAHYLAEAIQSAQSQTVAPNEIIVVDDGSPDDVRSVVSQFPGVHYIRQKNQGLSAARNSGFQLAKGEYVAYLDADDRFLPDALETQLCCFDAHPDSVFVSGQVRLISTDGSMMKGAEEPLVEKNHYGTLLRYCYIWTAGAVLFRRRIIQEMNGFNTELKSTGDWDFYLRAAREHPVYCHSRVVVEHRRHEQNMTHDSSWLLKDSLATLMAQERFVKGKKDWEDSLRTGIAGAKKFYGEPLVDEIQKKLEQRSYRLAMGKLISLYRFYPEGFRLHFYPRLCRSAFLKAEHK